MKNLTANKCDGCGAVTVDYINDEGQRVNISMRLNRFRKEFPNTRLDKQTFSSCNHCVNHWGIDLCGCGSGHKVGHCHEGHYECRHNIPAQELDKPKIYSLWN